MLTVANIARSKHVLLALAAAAALLRLRSRPRKGVKAEAVWKVCDGQLDAEEQHSSNVRYFLACTTLVVTHTLE